MLSEGYHIINVSLKGYDTEKETVYVSKGNLKRVKIILSKSSYQFDNDDSASSSRSSSVDQDYFYYPRTDFQNLKKGNPRHFDVSR